MSEDKKETIEQEATTEEAVVEETQETPVSEETTSTEENAEETAEEVKEEALTHVFSGDVEGEVYTFDQLDSPSDEYTADEYNQLMGMYENTLNTIEEKEIVTGRIVSIDRSM